jgi:hypothetical protein
MPDDPGSDLQVIAITYDLVLWTCRHLACFPRKFRFTLGDRLEHRLYDILDQLLRARYSRDRLPLLHTVNQELELLRFQFRLAKDLRYLALDSYDFVLLHDDPGWLAEARARCRDFLAGLRLRLHPRKAVIARVEDGTRFLGYRVFPTHRLLPRANVVGMQRRLRRLQAGYAAGMLTWEEVRRSLAGWLGHAARADTWQLREWLFAGVSFRQPKRTTSC